MRLWLLFLSAFFITSLSYAQLSVKPEKFPFEKVVEWPRKGTLFYGYDPQNTPEINISLLTHKGEVKWNRSIYKKRENTHLILSPISDYIYFVDDLELEDRYVRYNQINESGSVIPAKLNTLEVIRSYGYRTPLDLLLIDIINTPKSLVFYFQFPQKDKGIIENFFVSITHHNNKMYHCKGPATEIALLEEGKQEKFIYAGANESTISFAYYGVKTKASALNFFSFTPKGEKKVGFTGYPLKFNPIPSTINRSGLTGQYYLVENKILDAPTMNGKGVFVDGRYYYAVNDRIDRCLKIYGVDENDEFRVLAKSKQQAESKKKYKNATLTFIRIGKKVVVISKINDQKAAIEIDGKTIRSIDASIINIKKLRLNPSSYKLNDNSNQFVHFVNEEPYFFDVNQLGGEHVILRK